MKHLKLFEKFAGEGEIVYNSISDRIDSICKKYGIVNYTINKDGTVDVSGDVNLSHEELMELRKEAKTLGVKNPAVYGKEKLIAEIAKRKLEKV